MRGFRLVLAAAAPASGAHAQTAQQVVDIPTRRGVTQRMVVLTPPEPKAAVVLFAGGDGEARKRAQASAAGVHGR